MEGEKVYQKVHQRCAQLGITFSEVAERAGFKASRLSVLRRTKTVEPMTIRKLAKALQVNVDFFYE